jgi:hypothetical protein
MYKIEPEKENRIIIKDGTGVSKSMVHSPQAKGRKPDKKAKKRNLEIDKKSRSRGRKRRTKKREKNNSAIETSKTKATKSHQSPVLRRGIIAEHLEK